MASLLEKTEQVTGTYVIPEWVLGDVRARIAKLGKKALKLGLPAIEFDIIGSEEVELRPLFYNDVPRIIRKLTVRVAGGSPKLEGWHFVATLHRVPDVDEAIILAIPGEEIPGNWHVAPEQCDQCHVRRYRRDTYLVRHDDGTIKQVGSDCIKDFLGGHGDAQTLVAYAEYFAQLGAWLQAQDDDDADYDIDRIPRDQLRFHLDRFLVYVARDVRLSGGVFRTSKEYREESTGNEVWQTLCGAYRDKLEKHPVVEQDAEIARDILKYIEEHLTDREALQNNEYLYNLSLALAAGRVDYKTKGLVASVWLPYQRNIADQLRAAGSGDFFGEVGRRETWRLQVKDVKETEGAFGTTLRIQFKDEDGNVAVWWATNYPEVTVGEWLTVTGTVKKHEEYRGLKSTVLTRCKIKEA